MTVACNKVLDGKSADDATAKRCGLIFNHLGDCAPYRPGLEMQ